MLSELHVRDLGVIDDASVRFAGGMTALTGETGAGKTMLVEALDLVLGGRASSAVVRTGADEALVEAVFVLDAPTARAVAALVGSAEPHAEGGAPRRPGEPVELILARSVPATGRSRAWLDGRLVPIGLLADVGAVLVDIHGQHEHQSLVHPAAQRDALDAFADADRAPLEAARAELKAIDARLHALGGDPHQLAREREVLAHQVAEIDAAAIGDVTEDEALAAEAERLADLGAHREAAARLLDLLEAPERPEGASVTALLGAAIDACGSLGAFAGAAVRLRALQAEVDDVARELRQAAETWEDDPERLGEVQARRRLLADLRRKYGTTLEEVLAFADGARRRLAALEAADADAALLVERRHVADDARGAAEAVLRAERAAAAPRLAAATAARLGDLAMAGARLEVAVADEGAGEPVTFLLGANPGEPAQPLARVASGGELARAMLALRLVAEGGPPTMVFDEVDAGVGGAAALALGRALHEVARDRQVLVVTHLAQVAAAADHHVGVVKTVADGRTTATVGALDGEARTVELSRMLSGQPDSSTARAHAEELLAASRGAGHGARSGGGSGSR